jgi:hypothetical protein
MTTTRSTTKDPIIESTTDRDQVGVSATDRVARLGDTARDAAGAVSDAATAATPRISEAVASTADAAREADRLIRTSSDQALGMVGALSLGTAMGLLIGGGNRLLVALSLVPALLVATNIVQRMDRASGGPRPGR